MLILKYGGDPNISTKEGTSMHVAIKNDNEQVAIYLIEHANNLDLNIENAEGDNVLFYAVKLKANNIFTAILERAVKKPDLQQSAETIKVLNKIHRNGDHIVHQIAREMNVPLHNYIRNNHAFFNINMDIVNRENKTAKDIQVI
jgi:hypothetical protein